MKKAFSLVELIVVIGIIGILAGIMFTSFTGGSESARAARCLNNMRNLAEAAIGYAARGGTDDSSGDHSFPPAGSRAVFTMTDGTLKYRERRGWLSWLSMNDEYNVHKKGGYAKAFVPLPNASAYSEPNNRGDALFAITNGLLWAAVNGNRDVYVCPTHAIAMEKRHLVANWSYVMNAYFGYDTSDGGNAVSEIGYSTISLSSKRLDRTLLFAELPFDDHDFGGQKVTTTFQTSPNAAVDGILQYKGASVNGKTFNDAWNGPAESIAFNHRNGNKGWCAHVVFADGHTEKLLLPKQNSGLSRTDLTALLCGDDNKSGGWDVSFDGRGYTRVNDK